MRGSLLPADTIPCKAPDESVEIHRPSKIISVGRLRIAFFTLYGFLKPSMWEFIVSLETEVILDYETRS
jgi:hypothetical protein